MNTAIYYHAGCPVCTTAEQQLIELFDTNKISVEAIHLGEHKNQIDEAEKVGVKSVPALVLNGTVFHVNYGASLDEVRGV